MGEVVQNGQMMGMYFGAEKTGFMDGLNVGLEGKEGLSNDPYQGF